MESTRERIANWLMPVVEKIEAMNGKYKGYVFILTMFAKVLKNILK